MTGGCLRARPSSGCWALADREIKRLYNQGEDRYADSAPLELLNNLLYYVARVRHLGPARDARCVRPSGSRTCCPSISRSSRSAESLSAPSVKLMRTVGAAIKEDLTKVKDVLDIFVRKGGTSIDELAPQLELLRKISDTLGVLGLGGLRTRVQGEIAAAAGNVVKQGTPASDAVLVQMAATLISVEDSLDDQLVRLIMPRRSRGAGRGQPGRDRRCKRLPPGDRGGDARVHREPRARQGRDRARCRPSPAMGRDSMQFRSSCAASLRDS